MLPYRFHPLASRELDEAVGYYEGVSPGKGLELARAVRVVVERLQEFPESSPITRGTVRSALVQPSSRWEYTIHYRVKPTVIRILAIAHQSRQPFYWFGRR